MYKHSHLLVKRTGQKSRRICTRAKALKTARQGLERSAGTHKCDVESCVFIPQDSAAPEGITPLVNHSCCPLRHHCFDESVRILNGKQDLLQADPAGSKWWVVPQQLHGGLSLHFNACPLQLCNELLLLGIYQLITCPRATPAIQSCRSEACLPVQMCAIHACCLSSIAAGQQGHALITG